MCLRSLSALFCVSALLCVSLLSLSLSSPLLSPLFSPLSSRSLSRFSLSSLLFSFLEICGHQNLYLLLHFYPTINVCSVPFVLLGLVETTQPIAKAWAAMFRSLLPYIDRAPAVLRTPGGWQGPETIPASFSSIATSWRYHAGHRSGFGKFPFSRMLLIFLEIYLFVNIWWFIQWI